MEMTPITSECYQINHDLPDFTEPRPQGAIFQAVRFGMNPIPMQMTISAQKVQNNGESGL